MMTKNSALSTNATTSDRLTTVLSYGVLLLLIYLVFRIYEPFLAALGWAAILAIFFYPMHHRLLWRFSANKAAVLSTLAVTFLLIVPAILVTTLFIREAFAVSKGVQHTLLVQQAPKLARGWVSRGATRHDPAEYRGLYFRPVRDDLRDVLFFSRRGPDYPGSPKYFAFCCPPQRDDDDANAGPHLRECDHKPHPSGHSRGN